MNGCRNAPKRLRNSCEGSSLSSFSLLHGRLGRMRNKWNGLEEQLNGNAGLGISADRDQSERHRDHEDVGLVTVALTLALGCGEDYCRGPGAAGEALVELLDESAPPDCVITIDELTNGARLGGLLQPDLDLFDGDPDAGGRFNPRRDGVMDSFSIGFGFEAVRAEFELPDGE